MKAKTETPWRVLLGMAMAVIIAGFAQWPAKAIPAAPRTISHQGYITDQNSNPLHTLPGTVPITFAIYGVSAGGIALWSQTLDVAVDRGRYNVVLGPFPESLAFDQQYYLGISVGGDAEMIPRQQMTGTPYALNPGPPGPPGPPGGTQPLGPGPVLGSAKITGLQGESVRDCSIGEFEIYSLSLGVAIEDSIMGRRSIFDSLVLTLLNTQRAGALLAKALQGYSFEAISLSLYDASKTPPCIQVLLLKGAQIASVHYRNLSDDGKLYLDVAFRFREIVFEWEGKKSEYNVPAQTGSTCPLPDPLIFVASPPTDFPFENHELVARDFKFEIQEGDRGVIESKVQVITDFLPESPCFLGSAALGRITAMVLVERYSGGVEGGKPVPILRLSLEHVLITRFQIKTLPLGGFEQVLDLAFGSLEAETPPRPKVLP
jgi:hypothetical protein